MTIPATSRLVRAWRLFRLGLHIARGVLTAALLLPWASPRTRLARTRNWSRALLSLLGVRLAVRGQPPGDDAGNILVIANHVSWLDIYLLNATRPPRFVSKAEVRGWPVVGWLAAFAGTIFLERGRRRDTARVNDVLAGALADGGCVALFPEGTTSDGTRLKPFLPSLFQAAISAQSVLQPVALRYRLPDGGIDTAAAYHGDMSMMDSLRNILTRQEIRAELYFLEPMSCVGKTRRDLAREAENAISNALNQANPRRKPETAACPPAATQ